MRKLQEIEQSIKESLEEIQPCLQEDKGGAEFVRFEEETGVAELRLTGNCAICPLSNMTLRAGIERWLIKNVPEINRVEAIS